MPDSVKENFKENSKENSKPNPLTEQLERWWFGEDVPTHIAEVVKIANELKLDEATLIAAEHLDSNLSDTALTKEFGAEVAQMIRGYQSLQATRDKTADGQIETLRRMLLAFSADLRVVMIYLASRLQTLRWTTSQRIEVKP